MKTKHILLLAVVVAFSSCSTAYRSGQTPDDVYYSPAPALDTQDTYVRSDNQQDRNSYYNRNEDQEIRRAIQDPRYRSNVTLDLGYGYSPYSYGYMGSSFGFSNFGYNNYYAPYSPYSYNPYGYKGLYDPYGYNSYGFSPYSYGYNPYGYGNFGYSNYGYNYYNPYYGSYYPPVYGYPGIGNINTNSGPRKVNLGAYNNSGANIRNSGIRSSGSTSGNPAPVRSYQPSNQGQGSGVGNVIRRVFTPSNPRTSSPSNNRSYDRSSDNNTRSNNNPAPSRTFDNSSSSSSPSSGNSGGSSGSAPVRSFRK